MRFLIGTAVLIAALGSSAQEPARAYERILLPLNATATPGAFGSVWRTDYVVRNEGAQAISVFQLRCVSECSCTTFECSPGQALKPGENRRGFVFTEQFPASLFYVERGAALSANARLYEISQGARDFGTEIPIVREAEFLTGTAWMPNIPVSSDARIHLRIYGVSSPSGEGVVRIRVYAGEGDQPTFDDVRALSPALVIVPPYEAVFRIPAPDDWNAGEPGYLELALPHELARGENTLRVEIQPVTPQLAFWSFVSVTSNMTNRATLITPQ